MSKCDQDTVVVLPLSKCRRRACVHCFATEQMSKCHQDRVIVLPLSKCACVHCFATEQMSKCHQDTVIVLPLSKCRRCGWTQACNFYRVGQNRVRVYLGYHWKVVHSHALVVSLGLWPCTAAHFRQQESLICSFAFLFYAPITCISGVLKKLSRQITRLPLLYVPVTCTSGVLKKPPRQITNMPLPPNSRCLLLQNSLDTLLLLLLTFN